LFRHEFGHTIQSRLYGPLYLTSVGLPSLIGSGLNDIGWHSHDDEWNEIQANRMAYDFFTKFEPAALDKTQGGVPWDNGVCPKDYVIDWYFFIFPPPYWVLF